MVDTGTAVEALASQDNHLKTTTSRYLFQGVIDRIIGTIYKSKRDTVRIHRMDKKVFS